ncbi:hypothetical protein SBOR_10107 [Sclerotinia borealis F-4128]|uniref:Immediate-early protein n=1 Tax=Sclerotinia borealis (strain F-4128) TaxID=1432307 RepID=W9C3K0_SCLBF|nr:hypothetical protein SBOR_10107 [Sclerotinia borealis F-4128]
MFARLFRSSSKDCLQSDDPSTPSQQLREENRKTRSMVTTRGKARELADTPSVNGDSIVIDEGNPVPKKTGRPRKPLTVEDDEAVATTQPTRSSSQLPIQASDGEVTPKQSPQVVVGIPASAEQPEELQTIEADEEITKTTAINGDVTISSKTTTTITTPVAKKHKRFDSAEPEPIPEEKLETIEIEDDEDESSDDDAPEEVTTNQAAKSAKEKEREAAKAIVEYVSSEFLPMSITNKGSRQEAASKKKRQEKNAILKQQSKISGKKRKLDVASALDESLPPAQKTKVEELSIPVAAERGDIEMDEESNTLEGTADGRLDSENDIEEIDRTFAPPGHLPLPDLLPAEYLEDDDDSIPEPGNLHSSLPTRFVNSNKLRHLLEKRPKDKQVGSTTFRVAEGRNSHLPPKASNQARTLKESWLQGRAGTKIKPNRKPFNQAFIKPKN